MYISEYQQVVSMQVSVYEATVSMYKHVVNLTTIGKFPC